MNSSDLYRTVFGGAKQPYAWQQDFTTHEWPEVLIAPTGSGKTAGVTLGWVAHRLRSLGSTPRRLVWCLPMRTLVEQTEKAVKDWLGQLQQAGIDENGVLPKPKNVHVLMGGIQAARWLDDPEHPAVIIGTQDMLLSRALMRGYASSRAIWPMEFALLHTDTQWVFDEVQLMGAGRATSAQLEAFRRSDCFHKTGDFAPQNDGVAENDSATEEGFQPARSLWISATLKPDWLKTVDFSVASQKVVNVNSQAANDSHLEQLTKAKKNLQRAPAPIAPLSTKADDIKNYMAELADLVAEKHRPGKLTLVILNRVQHAQDLYSQLSKKLQEKAPTQQATLQATAPPTPDLKLVHSRFRAQERQEINKVLEDSESKNLIIVATQAVEAGVDISAAVLFTELAPWPSMVQRFGRANRFGKLPNGADIFWIDLFEKLPEKDDKEAAKLALPYEASELRVAREHLLQLTDAAPANLPDVEDISSARWVIRRKDIYDLFDTDPDLTGFDVDISPYVRDTDTTDVRLFWRDLSDPNDDFPPPSSEELCSAPIGLTKDWLKKASKNSKSNAAKTKGHVAFIRDPQWKKQDSRRHDAQPGWKALSANEDPQPGQTILVSIEAGGYSEELGFTGNPKHIPTECTDSTDNADATSKDEEGFGEDPRSEIGVPVTLSDHLGHVAAEAEKLCRSLGIGLSSSNAIIRAARWHDLGKAHDVFQKTMRKGLAENEILGEDVLLAKTEKKNLRHERSYFRHELASALAFLEHENWAREADLVAYLIAAHHGKVRMNIRALPLEQPPNPDETQSELQAEIRASSPTRFARGIWEGDELKAVDLGAGERWAGGELKLSIMELGRDEITKESWGERTHELLACLGPFRLAWLETLVRVADWRASKTESKRGYDYAQT